MGAAAEILTVSGILKVFEIIFGFIAIFLHRYGDYGSMVFFGTSDIQLQPVSLYLTFLKTVAS